MICHLHGFRVRLDIYYLCIYLYDLHLTQISMLYVHIQNEIKRQMKNWNIKKLSMSNFTFSFCFPRQAKVFFLPLPTFSNFQSPVSSLLFSVADFSSHLIHPQKNNM